MTPWCGREPRRWQPEAIEAVLGAFRRGVRRPLVQACTGAGKSIWLAELAAQCKGRVLVTTPSQALVAQLHQTLSDRCPGDVGLAYQHGWDVEQRIVVTCTASLPELLEEQSRWDCWVADEAHRLEGASLQTARDRIQCKVAVGLTATPFRADKRGLDWDELVYSYTSGRAIEDKVLVPWRAVRWDGTGKPTVDDLLDDWLDTAEGPGIVSATSVKDAEATAQRMGDRVLAIHGGMSGKERARRIAMLQAGELRALVHVALLVEGVDLPWLRWIALRRPVASPVRLVQEIGRVLRAHPGKDEAVIYDPYNLIGELGLTHAACLESALAAAAAEAAEDWHIEELDGIDHISRLPPPVAVELLSGWTADVLECLRSYELAPLSEYGPGPWRMKRVTPKQRDALGKMLPFARYFPYEPHRRAARWLAQREDLRCGSASDLMTVLATFADESKKARAEKRFWKCPVALPNVAIPEAA